MKVATREPVAKETEKELNKDFKSIKALFSEAELFRRRSSPETLKWSPNTLITQRSITKQAPFRVSKRKISSPKQRVSLQKPTTTTPWKQAIPESKQVETTPKPTRSLPKTSTPATTRSHELKKRSLSSSISVRQTNFQVSLAANNLLKKLKSTDTNTKCLGIQSLIGRLKGTPYSATRKPLLPTNVPKKVELSPVLMGILSLKNSNVKVAEKLMSWDSPCFPYRLL